MERDAHFQSLLLHIAQSTEKNKHSLLIQQNLTFFSESLIKEPPHHVPPTWPLWRDSPSPEPMVHLFNLIESPVKELSHVMCGKHMVTIHRSPCGQKSYIQWGAVWIFMTLLLLSQCHAAFSMILSTLAWVAQNPVCQRVIVTLYRCPIHTCYHLRDAGYGSM
jgi:hypothetical protein